MLRWSSGSWLATMAAWLIVWAVVPLPAGIGIIGFLVALAALLRALRLGL